MASAEKKSALPLYVAAAVWLCWGMFLTLYRVSDFLLCAGVSLGAALVVGALTKKSTAANPAAAQAQEKPKEEEKKSSGDPQIDALITERDKAVAEMRRLNDSIKGEKISAQIDHLEEMTGKITSYVADHPDKLPEIRKFMNYYLPTTLKLLNAYDRMDSTGVEGENIAATKTKIDAMLDTIVVAFDKQMDALFGDEALDISTDITVMEQMLAREGLGGQTMTAGG